MSEKIKPDFSNFSNANIMVENNDAVAKVMKSYKNLDKETKKEQARLPFLKKDKRGFVFVEPSLVELPSHGVCYKDKNDEDLNKGYIKMYPMTVREQEILSTKRFIDEGVATAMILNNCIVSNICADELLEFDYNYLLLYLRKISIDDSFKFKQHCQYCGELNIINIKISDLKFKELPEGFKEPIKIDLPETKYTILLRLPRVNDMRFLISQYKTLKDFENVKLGPIYSSRTLSIIDNNGEELEYDKWNDFYSSLPLKDLKVIIDSTVFDSNIENLAEDIKCSSCGNTIGGDIPITDKLFLLQ